MAYKVVTYAPSSEEYAACTRYERELMDEIARLRAVLRERNRELREATSGLSASQVWR